MGFLLGFSAFYGFGAFLRGRALAAPTPRAARARVCLQYTHYNSVYMVQYSLIYVTWKWVL